MEIKTISLTKIDGENILVFIAPKDYAQLVLDTFGNEIIISINENELRIICTSGEVINIANNPSLDLIQIGAGLISGEVHQWSVGHSEKGMGFFFLPPRRLTIV